MNVCAELFVPCFPYFYFQFHFRFGENIVLFLPLRTIEFSISMNFSWYHIIPQSSHVVAYKYSTTNKTFYFNCIDMLASWGFWVENLSNENVLTKRRYPMLTYSVSRYRTAYYAIGWKVCVNDIKLHRNPMLQS